MVLVCQSVLNGTLSWIVYHVYTLPIDDIEMSFLITIMVTMSVPKQCIINISWIAKYFFDLYIVSTVYNFCNTLYWSQEMTIN